MRTTIDLDDPSEIEIIRVWNHLEKSGDGRVLGRVSSSGHGVHLKVYGCNLSTVRRLRRDLGDDPRRREFDDESSLKPKQILFNSKPTGNAGEWSPHQEHVLAEYRRRCPSKIRYSGWFD